MAITADTLNADPLLYAACKTAIFDWMEANQVSRLICRFNGEGDSGAFDQSVEIDYEPDGSQPDRYTRLTNLLRETPAAPAAEITLHDLAMLIAEDVENRTDHGVDWWNNDGGQGFVEFILDGQSDSGGHYRRGIHLCVEARVVEFHGEHFAIEGEVTPEETPE